MSITQPLHRSVIVTRKKLESGRIGCVMTVKGDYQVFLDIYVCFSAVNLTVNIRVTKVTIYR